MKKYKLMWVILWCFIFHIVYGDSNDVELYPAIDQDLTGYIDESGRVVIKPRYEDGCSFSEGLAAVLADGKWGYINSAGEMVIEPVYRKVGPFSEGMAWVEVGGKYGYINREGKYIVEPTYKQAGPFSEGYAVVYTDYKECFMIDKTGKATLTPDVNRIDISGFSEGLVFGYSKKDGSAVYLDKTGAVSLSLGKGKNDGYIEGRPFSEGLAAVRVEGKWGFIDKAGVMVISPQYRNILPFLEGFACVEMSETRDHVEYSHAMLIDKQGKVLQALSVYPRSPCSEGLIRVDMAGQDGGRRQGYINVRGETVISGDYQETSPFRRGLARVKYLAKIHDRGVDGYINKQGVMIWKGRARGNQAVQSYFGHSMLDIYEKCLLDEDWDGANHYILRMTREEMVQGPLKGLEYYLKIEKKKAVEYQDMPRWAAMAMGIIAPFIETYSRSFHEENKPMDPSPFLEMAIRESLDRDFRYGLLDVLGSTNFYVPSLDYISTGFGYYEKIIRNEHFDEELRGLAAGNMLGELAFCYMEFSRQSDVLKNIKQDPDLRRRTYPDVVAMLRENLDQFSKEETAKLNLLIDMSNKTADLACDYYRASTKPAGNRGCDVLNALYKFNTISDSKVKDKVKAICEEDTNQKSDHN